MADNVKVDEGAGPAIATDEVGGAQHQKVKMEFGADGTATPVESGTPLPVEDSDAASLLTGLGALLTTIDADTGNLSTILTRLTEIEEDTDSLAAIKTAVEIIDNAIAGSEMQVDVVAPLPAGTANIGQVDPRGNVAHDSADSGNPVKVGARARSELAAVAQNDRVDAIADLFGRHLVSVAPLDQRVSATLNRANDTAGQLLTALSEGAYVVTAITVVNAHATVGTKVEILDEETAKWKGYAGALGGGFSIADPNGLFVGSKNKKLMGKCVTTGADVDITVSGYKVPA